MALAAVIFDMDGVLLDSEPVYDRATTAFVEELGFEADPRVYDLVRGLTVIDVWEVLAHHFGIDRPVAELAAESVRRLNGFFASAEGIEPRPGVTELLDELAAAGLPLAVASSSPRERIAIILRRLGIDHRLPTRVGGDDVVRGKPDPEVFLRAAEQLEVAPEHCVVIEDAARGVAAALAAGMRCVALDCGTDTREALAQAHLIIDDLRRLDHPRLLKLW
jgi:HAD superfamily hydrolase (TIGR01549 family)